ncbi:MAG: serine--tRNA ligase [Thermoplasmata archaeon]
MLNINLIRDNPDILRKSQLRRHADEKVVDKILELDKSWRENLKRIESLKRERNEKSALVAKLVRAGEKEGIEEIKNMMKNINSEIEKLETDVTSLKKERDSLLWNVPNIIDDAVPDGVDESENVPFRFWGEARVYNEDLEAFKKESRNQMQYKLLNKRPESHVDILEQYNLGDTLRAAKVAGARFYYLKNQLVNLELALEQFAVEHLEKKGFEIVEPPFMLIKRAIDGATDFTAFEDTLYKIENEDLYLIATSEHAIASMYMDEVFEVDLLPLKIAGISSCFRKEAGAHGKDTKGIFRVHQFNKIEQFVFCEPEQSPEFFNTLIQNAEEIYQQLNIPYRVIKICAGDLGNVASIKYDIEAWMPSQGKFRELVSCSNVKDYQSRRLNIRFRKNNEYLYPHTLNSTAIATTRTMVAILENYQTEEGIKVPTALRKYLDFDFISMHR